MRYQNPTQSKKKPSILRSRRTFLDPGYFAKSSVFKLIEPFYGLEREHLPQNPSQVTCKVLAFEIQACAESKISRFKSGFKSDTAVLTFPYRFHSTLILSFFLFI